MKLIGALFVALFLLSSTGVCVVIPQSRATGESVVADDLPYYRYDNYVDNFELIYPQEQLEAARHAATKLQTINTTYPLLYNWKMDQKLFVGLLSSHNQIPNAYSTQFPLNRQMNYPGGTQLIDEMSARSWLATLLYHETAHNYQLNVKANPLSQSLHTLFGNGFLFLPWLVIPNIVENPFMLEGNAVLNESLHENGGRLYNGHYKALTLLQAKAGNITPQNMYNLRYHVAFPYGNTPYIIGGFYNHFMAKRYGLERINSYFYNNSHELFFPFFTQESMRRSVGVGFEESLAAFAAKAKKEAQSMQMQNGELLAKSQFFAPLGSDTSQIYFLVNPTGKEAPTLVILDKKSKKVRRMQGSWIFGKVVKTPDGRYATQGSAFENPKRITQGLYDSHGELIEQTAAKMVQGYMQNKKPLYFDVRRSFVEPHLYVGSQFYAIAHSSAFVDTANNIYYFTQEKNKRTLYKNKTPLYSFLGYYGKVCDVDEKGRVYFTAASKHGSTLFCYNNKKIKRVTDADNIIDARLIDKSTLLYATITDKEYRYIKAGMHPFAQEPFFPQIALSKGSSSYMQKASLNEVDINLSKPYNAIKQLHYAGSDFTMGYADTLFGTLNVNFADALTQNALHLYAVRDEENISVVGGGYANAEHLLSFYVGGYAVVEKGEYKNIRNYGAIVQTCLPLYKKRYDSIFAKAGYIQDYTTHSRAPLSLTLALAHKEHYGVAMFFNDLHAINLYMQKERKDTISGAAWRRIVGLPYEFYLLAGAKLSYSSGDTSEFDAYKNNRGVKVQSSGDAYGMDLACSNMAIQNDVATLTMPTIDGYGYFRLAGYVEGRVDKTLNFSFYRFTFPLSLQREALSVRYRRYELERFGGIKEHVNEYMLSLRADIVLLNSMGPIPLSLAYYHNDNSFVTANENQIKFAVGFSF